MSDKKSTWEEVKGAWEQLQVERLRGEDGEQMYRWYVIMLLYQMFGCLDSIAYSYREMLKIQREKSGIRPQPPQPPQGGQR